MQLFKVPTCVLLIASVLGANALPVADGAANELQTRDVFSRDTVRIEAREARGAGGRGGGGGGGGRGSGGGGRGAISGSRGGGGGGAGTARKTDDEEERRRKAQKLHAGF